jgi:hypothetical protein
MGNASQKKVLFLDKILTANKPSKYVVLQRNAN